MDYIPVYENLEKMPEQVSLAYVEVLPEGQQQYEKVSRDGNILLDASELENGIIIARAAENQDMNFKSLFEGLSRDSSNEQFAQSIASVTSSVLTDKGLEQVLDVFSKQADVLRQIGQNADLYSGMVYNGTNKDNEASFSNVRDDVTSFFQFLSMSKSSKQRLGSENVYETGKYFKRLVGTHDSSSSWEYGERSALILENFGKIRKYHDNEKEINDLAIAMMKKDKSLVSSIKRFEKTGKQIENASKSMLVSLANASVANAYESSHSLAPRLEKMNNNIKSFHERYGEEMVREGLKDSRTILGYAGNPQLKKDFIALNTEVSEIGRDMYVLKQQVKSSNSFFVENGDLFSGANLRELKERNQTALNTVDNALGDAGNDSLFGKQVTNSMSAGHVFANNSDENTDDIEVEIANKLDNTKIVSNEFLNSRLQTKEEAMEFMQAVASDCMQRGISSKDARTMQLGRTIHAFQKRLSDPVYQKEDVVSTISQIAQNEPARVGSLEAIYERFQQKKEQGRSNLVNAELDLSDVRKIQKDNIRGSR